MTDLLTTPSVNNLMRNWTLSVKSGFRIAVDQYSVATDLPREYTNSLPFLRIARVAGPQVNGIIIASVRVESFALSYDDAETLANDFDSAILQRAAGFTDGQGTILGTPEVPQGPVRLPWTDEAVVRFLASYTVRVGAAR